MLCLIKEKAKLCANSTPTTDNTPNTFIKFAALLMLYPTERLDLLAADAQIDARLKHQKQKMRPRAEEKVQKEKPRNGLFKPFLGLFVWQGQKDLNP